MSLTRHLGDRASPVRAWFDQRLPHTAAVARDANHELRLRRWARRALRRERTAAVVFAVSLTGSGRAVPATVTTRLHRCISTRGWCRRA
jgi:hypothetical protein